MTTQELDNQKEIEAHFATVAECMCDLDELMKCNAVAVTDDVKAITVGTFHVLSERISSNLHKGTSQAFRSPRYRVVILFQCHQICC